MENKSEKEPIKVDASSKQLAGTLWRLSYPSMIAMGLQFLYDLVDMVWVGQISKTAISGVTLFTSIYVLFGILNEIAGASSVSMISQNYGRGDMEKTRRIAEQTISFKIVLAVLSGILLAVFLKPLLYFFLPNQDVIQAALEYGRLRLFFIPVMFSSYSVNTIFRCTGDAKTPMRIMLVSAVLNMILDPVFMFDVIPGIGMRGLGLGVFGASLATVLSQGVSFLYGFFVLLNRKNNVTITLRGLFVLDKKIDKDLLLIGLPSGVNLLLRMFSQTVILKFVAAYGADAVALAGVGSKFNQFAFMPIFGFSMGASAMVGQSLGRENVREAQFTAKLAAVFSVAVISVFTAAAFRVPHLLLWPFFKNDSAALKEGALMLKISYTALPILAAAMGIGTVFRGSGYYRPLLYATGGARWLVHIPVLFLTVNILQLPLFTVWSAFVLSEIAEAVIVYYHYKKGVWRSSRV